MMRSIVLQAPGEPHGLSLVELPVPEPGPGENQGPHQGGQPEPGGLQNGQETRHPAWIYPFIPGLDGAGIVDKVGEGVTQWNEGDRVVYHGKLH